MQVSNRLPLLGFFLVLSLNAQVIQWTVCDVGLVSR